MPVAAKKATKKKSRKKAAKKKAAKKKTAQRKTKKKATKKKAKKKVSKKKATKKVSKKKTTKKVSKKKTTKKKSTKKKTTKKKVSKKKSTKKTPKKKSSKKKTTKKKTTKKKATKKKPRRRSANARKPVALHVGDPAPAFELDGDDGKTYSLAKLSGQRVVLYFYPKDNTSGCTAEARDFQKALKKFKSAKAVVLGVSSDTLESHKSFRSKNKLTFPLLTDPGHKIATSYGTFGKKTLYGKVRETSIRGTFIISPRGRIEAMYLPVRGVKGHVAAVLKDAQAAN